VWLYEKHNRKVGHIFNLTLPLRCKEGFTSDNRLYFYPDMDVLKTYWSVNHPLIEGDKFKTYGNIT